MRRTNRKVLMRANKITGIAGVNLHETPPLETMDGVFHAREDIFQANGNEFLYQCCMNCPYLLLWLINFNERRLVDGTWESND